MDSSLCSATHVEPLPDSNSNSSGIPSEIQAPCGLNAFSVFSDSNLFSSLRHLMKIVLTGLQHHRERCVCFHAVEGGGATIEYSWSCSILLCCDR